MIFTRRFGTLRARQTFPSVTVTGVQGRDVETIAPARESQDTAVAAAGTRTTGDHKHAA